MIDLVRIDVEDFALLAELFEYPDAGFAARAAQIAVELHCPATAAHLAQFSSEIAVLSPELMEEAHVRTFLVAPASAPYVGLHLFGEESFKRAHMMAQFVERFRALDFDPGIELPDHLGVLLRFARLLEADERADLVRWCFALPVTAMQRSLVNTQNPYRHLLAGLLFAVAPEGVPEEVHAAVVRAAQAPDLAACGGCTITHGADEP